MSQTNNDDEIIQNFFDFFDKYMDLQCAIEHCAPYFSLPYGKKMVDDLLRIAIDYSIKGERLIEDQPKILTRQPVLDRMALSIGKLGERISKIHLSSSMSIHSDIQYKEFNEYVTETLTAPGSEFYAAGFEGREWHTNPFGDIACRNKETKELNGVMIARAPRNTNIQVPYHSISYFISDTAVFRILISADGSHKVIMTKPPVEVEISDSPEPSDKTETSEVSWPAVLAGAAGGLILTSLLRSKQNRARSKANEKELPSKVNTYGITKI